MPSTPRKYETPKDLYPGNVLDKFKMTSRLESYIEIKTQYEDSQRDNEACESCDSPTCWSCQQQQPGKYG